jgi:hypothetical protein
MSPPEIQPVDPGPGPAKPPRDPLPPGGHIPSDVPPPAPDEEPDDEAPIGDPDRDPAKHRQPDHLPGDPSSNPHTHIAAR